LSRALIETAARSHPRTSKRGLLESLFAQLFTGFVYPQIWEDPRVDLEALRRLAAFRFFETCLRQALVDLNFLPA